jgi:hypothetical protein
VKITRTFVYAFKSDRLFARVYSDYHNAGGVVTSLRSSGWRVFSRRLK